MIAAMLNEQSDEEEIHVTSHVTNYPADAENQETSASNQGKTNDFDPLPYRTSKDIDS